MTEETRQRLVRVQQRLHVLSNTVRQNGSTPENWGHQEEIIGLLTDVTNNFADAVDTRRDEHIEVVQRITTLESDIKAIARDVNSLCRVVRDGNGQPSMVHRLSAVENTLLNQARQIDEISEYANSIVASRMLTRTQLVVGLSGMLLTGLISFAALVATLLKP